MHEPGPDPMTAQSAPTDREIAQQYLDHLQRRNLIYAVDVPHTATEAERRLNEHRNRFKNRVQPLFEAPIGERELDQLIDAFRGLLQDAPASAFHSPEEYLILRSLCATVESIAADLYPAAPRPGPLFGVLPVGELAAITVAVPFTSECVVLVSGQVFKLANHLSKIIADSLVYELHHDAVRSHHDPRHVLKKLRRFPEIGAMFTAVVLSFAVTGRSMVRHRPRRPFGTMLRGELLQSMELAIVAHEYAHILCGHVGKASAPQVVGAMTLTEIEYQHSQEYEADEHAVLMCSALGRDLGNQHAQLAAGFATFLKACDVIARARMILTSGTEAPVTASRTHPAPEDRVERIRAALTWELFGDRSPRAMQVHDDYCAILDALWERTRPVIVRAHRAGVRPKLDVFAPVGSNEMLLAE